MLGMGFLAKKYIMPEKGKKFAHLFQSAEGQYNLPKNLLARMAHQESYFTPTAYNKSGAQGIMQIIPRWHPEIKNAYDPNEAIPYAGKYMRQLYNQFGNWKHALAAYNWGPGNVKKWLATGGKFSALPEETQGYVKNISKDVKLT